MSLLINFPVLETVLYISMPYLFYRVTKDKCFSSIYKN